MDAKFWIEVVAIATMPIAIVAIIVERIARDRGIGVRVIQFLGICLLLPLTIILAIEGILERSAVGALVGAIAGYLFANIGEYDKKRGQPTKTSDADD